MMEAEHIVNSRPLTFVPIEVGDNEALTPNHFLLGTSSGIKNPGPYGDEVHLLRKGWRKGQNLADHFWRRWMREYLPVITRRTKWIEKAKPIETRDVVVIADSNMPRSCWPKGRVIEVISSKKDNQVRQVIVQTTTGIYKRPAVKIAVLDVMDGKGSLREEEC